MMVPSSGQRLRRRLRMRFSGPAEKLDLQLAAGRDEAAFLDGGDLCWRRVAFGAPRKVQLAGRADGCRVLVLAKGRRFGRQLCGNLVLLIKFSTRPLCAGRNSVQMTGAAILNSRIFAASRETSPADLDMVFASMRRCEAASHADGWLSCYAPVLDPAKLHRATNSRQCQHSSASPTNPRHGIHFDARSITEVFKTAVAASQREPSSSSLVSSKTMRRN